MPFYYIVHYIKLRVNRKIATAFLVLNGLFISIIIVKQFIVKVNSIWNFQQNFMSALTCVAVFTGALYSNVAVDSGMFIKTVMGETSDISITVSDKYSQEVDTVVISHGHIDHGGASKIFAN